MNQDPNNALASLITTQPRTWVSGLYVLEEAPLAAVVVVTATPDLYETAVYNYSFLGFGDWQFFAYERLVWPVGADVVYRYLLMDEVRLEIAEEIPISKMCDEDQRDELEPDLPEEIARVFAPHLGKLLQMNNFDGELSDLMEDDIEAFGQMFPGLLNKETPDFWK